MRERSEGSLGRGGPHSTTSLSSVSVNEGRTPCTRSPSSLPVCAVGGLALAERLMQGKREVWTPAPSAFTAKKS